MAEICDTAFWPSESRATAPSRVMNSVSRSSILLNSSLRFSACSSMNDRELTTLARLVSRLRFRYSSA